MSRLLLLFICLIWMTGVSEPAFRSRAVDLPDLAVHGLTLPAIVLALALWSRLVSRRVTGHNFIRLAKSLGWATFVARGLVFFWFVLAVFYLGWPGFVLDHLGIAQWDHLRLPGLFLGTLPVMLAWIGLWWAQYPADQALRFQGQTDNLVAELPVHRPPGMMEWLLSTVRLQLLFTVLPVFLIAAVHDVTTFAVFPILDSRAAASVGDPLDAPKAIAMYREQADGILWLCAIAVVFLIAPEVLRRILKTSPLADGPLRRRLEFLCRRSGIKCRDILVWDTHFNFGNAAVMGLIPRFRYVLLSDLLLERMDNEQIEAVFAHEAGHVVHRHMGWYVVFFIILMLVSAGPGLLLADFARNWIHGEQELLMAMLGGSVAGVLLAFGYLSRRFERQADVYAARMMEAVRPADAAAGAAAMAPFLDGSPRTEREVVPTPIESRVGTYGSQLFASALHKVASINNISVAPRSRTGGGLVGHVSYAIGSLVDLAHDWLHGSIASRMEYLQNLSDEPTRTDRFDRTMTRLYSLLLFILIASAAYAFSMRLR